MGHFKMLDTRLYHSIERPKAKTFASETKVIKTKNAIVAKFTQLLFAYNVKDEFLENIQASQIELDQFYEFKTEKAMIRNMAKWFGKGERNIKIFSEFRKEWF